MALELVWTEITRSDLREVVTYIARDDSTAERKVGDGILKEVEVLSGMPQLGRMVPERGDKSIRELVRGNYRIVRCSADILVCCIAGIRACTVPNV